MVAWEDEAVGASAEWWSAGSPNVGLGDGDLMDACRSGSDAEPTFSNDEGSNAAR